MELFIEIIEFLFFTGLIVLISKNILVKTLRDLAENLKLKSKTIGSIAGVATSIPELLTVSISSFQGLVSASIYNILSSNVINLVQYYFAIILNKNRKFLKNKAIITDVVLVIITIIIPILMILVKIDSKIIVVPIFIILYFWFKKINDNAHKLYLKSQDKEMEKIIKKEDRWERGNKKKAVKNIIILIIVGIMLFFIGNLLGNTLENLSHKFNVPELVIGIVLGFITSIPELITFIESQKYHKNDENNVLGVVEATNNLLMSNILNLFIIQSIGIVIFTIMYG